MPRAGYRQIHPAVDDRRRRLERVPSIDADLRARPGHRIDCADRDLVACGGECAAGVHGGDDAGSGLKQMATLHFGIPQSTANSLLRRSVTSMQPGACVIAKGGRAARITDCGVTPQAQNTGISSSRTVTASP